MTMTHIRNSARSKLVIRKIRFQTGLYELPKSTDELAFKLFPGILYIQILFHKMFIKKRYLRRRVVKGRILKLQERPKK